MKNVLYGILAVSLLIGAPASLMAQNQTNPTEANVVTTEARAKDFSLRLEGAMKKFDDGMSSAKEQRVAAACKVAQTRIGDILKKTQDFQARHGEIHQNWLTEQADLSAKIAVADINTTMLDSHIQQANALVVQSSFDLESYISALKDTGALDCEADVVTFYSSLQRTRAIRSLVVDKAEAVLTHIRTNVITELQNMKHQLRDDRQAPDVTTGEAPDQTANGGSQ